jgi:hypothetical protein
LAHRVATVTAFVAVGFSLDDGGEQMLLIQGSCEEIPGRAKAFHAKAQSR